MQNSKEQKSEIQIPVNTDELSDPPEWASVKAKTEERKWDDLEDIKKDNDKRWLRAYGWVLLSITVVFTFVFIAALLVWTFHYLTPEHWHWLGEQQLSKIQSVLFSGGMGAVVSGMIRSQLKKTYNQQEGF